MSQNIQPLGHVPSTLGHQPEEISNIKPPSSPPITPVKRLSISVPMPSMTLPATPRTSLDERPDLAVNSALGGLLIFAGHLTRGAELGAGTWSNVYAAERTSFMLPQNTSTDASLTPPPSPGIPATVSKKLYAIKTPSALEKDAKKVLINEARILTSLSRDAESISCIIGFHGIDERSGGLVMDFAPFTLKTCVDARLKLSSTNLSTRTMYDPIVGEQAWKHFARQLIRGLAWLHSKGVAHGDIKAANILMQPNGLSLTSLSDTPNLENLAEYQPLLCDFSSAVDKNSSQAGGSETYDAFTTSYASPELMTAWLKRASSSRPCDRQKADVWAMAVCLVLAAVGSEPYSVAKNEFTKQQMAAWGDILGDARSNSGHGTRIMKGGYVAKTVACGLAVDPVNRVAASQWLEGLTF